MKRKTRFADGGLNPYQGDDVDPFSAMRNKDGGTAPMTEGPSSEELRDETGAVSKLRRNLETGELYDTEARPAKPVRLPSKPTPRPAPPAPSPRAYAAEARKADMAAEQKSVKERQARLAKPGADAIESDTDTLTPFPGVAGLLRKGAAGARALATKAPSLSELTFLGRSGARNVTPPRQIGGSDRKLLKGPEAGDRVGGKGSPPSLPAPARALEAPKGARGSKETPAQQRATAEAMERAKPMMQSRPDTKASRASRTRRTEEDAGIEFAKGGTVRGWGKARGAKPFKVR